VELLYKPFGANPDEGPVDLNWVSGRLHEKVKRHTFAPMRSLFLQHMVTACSPQNLTEAAAVVAALSDRPKDPKDAAIESLGDVKLVRLLKALKSTNIHVLRNRIVHKQAYRPTREEVEAALEETRAILFSLTAHLIYTTISTGT
jgi:hypothetical protein